MEQRIEALEAEQKKVRHVVFGNGKRGLVDHVRALRNDVYRDERTGRSGLVDRVATLEREGAEHDLEQKWLVRIIFGMFGLQTVFGPDAVALFVKSMLGGP